MPDTGAWPQRWESGKSVAKEIWEGYNQDRVPIAAAAVAFYLLLAMIPLLLLLISLAAFFITPTQATAMVAGLTRTLGPGISGAIQSEVLTVVMNRGLLTGISLLIGIWAGSQIFVIIASALNQIWDIREDRPFWKLRGMAIVMVFATGVLLAIAVLMTSLVRLIGEVNIPILGIAVGEVPLLLFVLVGWVVPFVLATLVFLMVFRFLSARKVTWGTALPGAVFSGVFWVIILQVFSWYTANIADYSVLYGSLGGLVLLMLWFNYSAQIMLVGAEYSAIRHHRRYEEGKIDHRWEQDEPFET